VSEAKEDYALYVKQRQVNDKGEPINTLTVDGAKVPEGAEPGTEAWLKAQGERMIELDRTARTSGAYAPVGSIGGLRLMVKTTDIHGTDAKGQAYIRYENIFCVESATGHLKYLHKDGYVNRVSALYTASHPMTALERIPELVAQWEEKARDCRARIEELNAIIAEDWPKEEELDRLRRELSLLDQKINSELKGDSEPALQKAA
jgi:uncharacterized coiled-coil protein SlyX